MERRRNNLDVQADILRTARSGALKTRIVYQANTKRRRDRTEILADLLRVAQSGALKTQLVYRCNLNFRIIKRYLQTLQDRDLLRKQGNHYYTTERGSEYIVHADALRI